ncbi:hypothetical protein ZWY2020_036233 [Hordeum vulgare]|nr:hypothetical protein ZWY2020_036233 [Hordeum vulgare]
MDDGGGGGRERREAAAALLRRRGRRRRVVRGHGRRRRDDDTALPILTPSWRRPEKRPSKRPIAARSGRPHRPWLRQARAHLRPAKAAKGDRSCRVVLMLGVLKHMLSGPKGSSGNSSDGSQDLIVAVRLLRGIKGMEKLETLSHVEAPGKVNDLTDVGHLLQLSKLGVILAAEKGGLGVLFQQIEKLHGCLRSLSIQMNKPPKAEDTLPLASPPKLLQSLNISGIRSGLLLWIAELDQLTKLTLCETYLREDYIHILGKLASMRCLRLRRNTYAGSGLTFNDGEFKSLKPLVVDDGVIANITFETGTVPNLERIVWNLQENFNRSKSRTTEIFFLCSLTTSLV